MLMLHFIVQPDILFDSLAMKIIAIVLPLFLIWWIIRTLLRTQPNIEKKPPDSAKKIVACQQCGLHVPEDEAVTAQGRSYCSIEHARKDQAG